MSTLKFGVSIFLAFIFICDGFFINFVQFILFLFVKPIDHKLYRKLNYYLTYTSWCQIVALSQYWSNNDLTVYYLNKDTKEHFGKEHSLVIMNHKYEIDWLYSWLIMNKLGCLGSSKSYVKKTLKWVPIIGWSFYFAEFIFLERNWDKDSLIMGKGLDNLMGYEDKVNLLLFAEGTRYTKQKYESSFLFAKEKGLKILKHHLVPRTRGFNYTVKHLKNKLNAIYNIHIEFPKSESYKPTFISVLKCLPLKGYVFIERIPMNEIPTESDEKLNEFLYDLYIKKDALTDYFLEHNRFQGDFVEKINPRLVALLNLIFWVVFTLSVSFLLTYNLIVYQFYKLLFSILIVFGLLTTTAFFLLVRSTRTVRGSSYGTSNTSIKDKKTS